MSSVITSNDGSSSIFKLALITYSNESKINILKVPKKIIKKYGAVSVQCCLSMVNNLSKISNSQVNVSVTGIAGPKGGSKDKPVGLVFIGLKFKKKMFVNKYLFQNKSRVNFQKAVVNTVIKIVLSIIK